MGRSIVLPRYFCIYLFMSFKNKKKEKKNAAASEKKIISFFVSRCFPLILFERAQHVSVLIFKWGQGCGQEESKSGCFKSAKLIKVTVRLIVPQRKYIVLRCATGSARARHSGAVLDFFTLLLFFVLSLPQAVALGEKSGLCSTRATRPNYRFSTRQQRSSQSAVSLRLIRSSSVAGAFPGAADEHARKCLNLRKGPYLNFDIFALRNDIC